MKHFSKIALLLMGLAFVGASCGNTVEDGGVFRSEDGSENYKQKVFVSQEKRKVINIDEVDIRKLEMSPHSSNIVFAATNADGVYKTTTGGEQWTKLGLADGTYFDFEVSTADANVMFTVYGNTILRSTDAGQNWSGVYTDAQNSLITQVEIDWFNTQRIYATSASGTLLVSENGGDNWTVRYEFDELPAELVLDPSDSRIMYLRDAKGGLFKTIDNGSGWEEIIFDDELKNYDKVIAFAVDPNDTENLFVSTDYGMLRSSDRGATWIKVTLLIEEGSSRNKAVNNITVMPGDSNTIIFTVDNLIHKSTDNAGTWKTIANFPSNRAITELVVNPANTQQHYAGVTFVEEDRNLFGPRIAQ